MNQALACVQVFRVRNKMNLGNKSYFPKVPQGCTEEELLAGFIGQYYLQRRPPEELITTVLPSEHEIIAEMLSNQREAKVKITASVRGTRARWLDFANKNVSIAFESRLASQTGMEQRYRALEDAFSFDAQI